MSRISNARQRVSSAMGTHRGHWTIGIFLLLGILLFNYFLNNIWSMLIVVGLLAVIGWIQTILRSSGRFAGFAQSRFARRRAAG